MADHPFFFVKYGDIDKDAKAMFNMRCKCHNLLDTIKRVCLAELDKRLRKRLGEIYEDLKLLRKKIRKLDLIVATTTRTLGSTAASTAESSGAVDANEGSSRESKYEMKLKLLKEDEEKLLREEEKLQHHMEIITNVGVIELGDLNNNLMNLRFN